MNEKVIPVRICAIFDGIISLKHLLSHAYKPPCHSTHHKLHHLFYKFTQHMNLPPSSLSCRRDFTAVKEINVSYPLIRNDHTHIESLIIITIIIIIIIIIIVFGDR